MRSHFFVQFKQIWDKLIPPRISLQAKILKYTCLATIVGSISGLFMNASLGFPIQLNIVMVLFLIPVIWLFFKMPLYSHYNRSGIILILIELVTIALNWFANGGIYSSGPYFVMVLICFTAVVLTGFYLWSTISFSVLLIIFLMYLEIKFPEWVQHHHPDTWQVKADIVFAISMLSFSFAWFINFMLKKYKQQLEIAETANYAKTLFLSQLSHELRTPLNSVIGFSGQLIEKGEHLKPVQQKLFAETIRKNGAHLLALVNQVIDLSLIETGKLELFWQDVNVNQILKEIEEVVALDAQNKNLAYHLSLPEADIYVKSDPHRLRQILINLINNAIKYTPQGSVSCLVNPLAEGVQIDIQDTGSGIPVEQQKLIFEPFTRLETHRDIQGNGIGLTITQTLCQHLGSTLFLKHSSQEGSTFSVFIPYEHSSY